MPNHGMITWDDDGVQPEAKEGWEKPKKSTTGVQSMGISD